MEGDNEVQRLIREKHFEADALIGFAEEQRQTFQARYDESPQMHIANRRYQAADDIGRSCIKSKTGTQPPLSDKIDRYVCHRLLGPVILLINIYFAAHKGLAMFFISTISLLLVLPVSKILTLTVLKKKEMAPFVMELPPYHVPTLQGVLGRAVERVWLFVRKITTIVAAVAVIIFVLLQFPGISDERMTYYNGKKDKAVAIFLEKINTTGGSMWPF